MVLGWDVKICKVDGLDACINSVQLTAETDVSALCLFWRRMHNKRESMRKDLE